MTNLSNINASMGSVKKIAIQIQDLPGWKSGNLNDGFAAFLANCKAGHEKSPGWSLQTWKKICSNAETINPGNTDGIKEFLTSNFSAFLITSDSEEEGLFTGYYQPIAEADVAKSNEYSTPIYRKPPELIVVEDLGEFREDLAGFRLAGHMVKGELKPYYTRAEINKGILEGKGLEIAWLKSPVDAFFIAVQGSGLLQMLDGSQISIGYDGANGHPYTSIGKVLKERNYLPENNVNMQSIRQWLSENPDKLEPILNTNKSYIFFKKLPQSQPEGAHKVGLTPKGSLAVDPRFVPLGSLLWVSISTPKLDSLMVAQDTGSAIKGIIRGDFYWGTGNAAGEIAGKMATKGRYFLLEPKVD